FLARVAADGLLDARCATVSPPLLPPLVALLLRAAPALDPFAAGQIVACTAAALAALPLWHLARRLSGDAWAAHFACLAYTLGVWFARHPAGALSEGVFPPLAAGSVERLLAARGRPRPAATAGLLAGLAYGARPEAAALLLCGVPWLLARDGPRRRGSCAQGADAEPEEPRERNARAPLGRPGAPR